MEVPVDHVAASQVHGCGGDGNGDCDGDGNGDCDGDGNGDRRHC